MLWNRKKKLKEKREKEYLKLNKKFLEKHQIVCDYYVPKYLVGIGLQPISEEGFEYQRRMKNFFGEKYGQLPKSFNPLAGINYGFDKNFDYHPVEKLMELYNQIEIVFPEPFIEVKKQHCL
jgi:hypothetical protein